MSTKTTQRRGLLAVSWAAAAALSAGFLFGNSAALAAAPPANTIIGNQATAAYLDPNGLARTATSNLVQTTVQQVGSFTLDARSTTSTPDPLIINTKTGAAGSVIYAPHVLTNTGNGADGFSITVAAPTGFESVAIYTDANGDGLPDSTTPICTASATGCTTTSAQTVAGNNGQFQFVVAYAIPSTADAAVAPWLTGPHFGTVSAQPASIMPDLYAGGVNGTSPYVVSVRDQVSLTTLAAFNLTKAITKPAAGVLAPGSVAWPAAPVAGQRSDSTLSCSTNFSAGLTAGCQYTVFTLNFSNTGGAAGRVNFTDELPLGFTYVDGSAVWSSQSGVAMSSTDVPSTYFSVTGQDISGAIQSLPVNTTQSISFIVLVNDTAALGTTTTTNTALYSATVGGPVTSPSNPASFTVTGTYSIALGAVASTAATALDVTNTPTPGTPNPGTPNGDETAGADTTVAPPAPAGSAVPFTVVVYNTGNATDTVEINAVMPGTGGTTVFPAGTTFSYFKADGFTPLSNTNATGGIDTGPIPAGGAVNIVVKANLPANVAIAGPTAGYTLTVTGTSAGDATKIDATRGVLNVITGVLVDLTNSENGGTGNNGGSDIGTGPSTTATNVFSVAAGGVRTFDLWIANNDTGFNNTYNLSAGSTPSMGALPAGWTVKFVEYDAAATYDSTADAANAALCTAGAAIPSIAVDAGDQARVLACISVPATQAAVTAQPIYFEVRSTATTSTGGVVVDIKYDAVTVTAAAATFAATLTPNNSGQVAPGGSIVYAHTLAATGTGSCTGNYSLSVAKPDGSPLDAGWTYALYEDGDGDGQLDEATDDLITGPINGPLLPGANNARKYLVKLFAPGGAVAGTVNTAAVTVTFATANGCGSPSATDTTTVITGQIRLVKTQEVAASCAEVDLNTATSTLTAAAKQANPGQCIVYRVVATNEGAAPVSNLTIFDAVPAWTTLSATQPTTRCESTGVTPAFGNGDYNSTVKCGTTTNTVAPSGTATLTFSVKVNSNTP